RCDRGEEPVQSAIAHDCHACAACEKVRHVADELNGVAEALFAAKQDVFSRQDLATPCRSAIVRDEDAILPLAKTQLITLETSGPVAEQKLGEGHVGACPHMIGIELKRMT